MQRCPRCGARNPDENTTCRDCGAVLGLEPTPAPEATTLDSASDELVTAAHTGETTAPEPGEETQDLQIGRAVLFGVAVAAVLGVIWYFLEDVFQWSSAMVLLMGWLTGFAVTYGAGKKRGRPLQLLSLGITLVTVLVVRFLLDGLANPAAYLANLWTWVAPASGELPLNLLFVMGGLWYAYTVPRPQPKRQQQEEPAEEESAGEEGEGEATEDEEGAPDAAKEDPSRKCVRCQAYIPPGEALLVPGGMRRGTLLVCHNCTAELEARFTAETEDIQLRPAILYGVGAALLIAVGWFLLGIYTGSPLVSIIGFAAGWILPEVLRFGAGKKRGRVLQYIAVGLTLAVIVGVNIALAATASAGLMRTVGFHLAGILTEKPVTVTPPPFLTNLGRLLADPLTDMIYLLALFQAYTGPAPRKLGGVRESETTKAQEQ